MFDHSFDPILRAFGGFRRMSRASRTAAALHRLDDRTLRDIGIERAQIPGIALDLASKSGADMWHRT